MEGLFDGVVIDDFHDDLYRNIVSLRQSQDLFDDLTDSPGGIQAAINLEMASKPRTFVSQQPIIDRPFEEAKFNEAIQYPFEHWAKTRYSDGSFGVWYGAADLETTVHETVYHWRSQFLTDVGWQDIEGIEIERKVFLVRCDAGLLNFIAKIDDYPALIDPNQEGYHLTHQVGARIHHDGHPGLVTKSARCDGLSYAIFNSVVLSNPRQQCYLTYRVHEGGVVVERNPDDVIFHIP